MIYPIGVKRDSRDSKETRCKIASLIWSLGHCQHDPKKAIAELIQNCMDAKAGTVLVEISKKRITISDNGKGIFPEMSDQMLTYVFLGENVGYSHKASVPLEQRIKEGVQGKFGIGLLSFTALGGRLTIRTIRRTDLSQPNGHFFKFMLEDGSASYAISAARATGWSDRWEKMCTPKKGATGTTLVIDMVSPSAFRKIQRVDILAKYLSRELRGQLQKHGTKVVLKSGRKVIELEVQQCDGELIKMDPIYIGGYIEPIQPEIYIKYTGTADGLYLSGGGTRIDDFTNLDAVGLNVAPWVDRRVTGYIEWAHLSPVATRGALVARDRATIDFLSALAPVEEKLTGLLRDDDKRKKRKRNEEVAKLVSKMFGAETLASNPEGEGDDGIKQVPGDDFPVEKKRGPRKPREPVEREPAKESETKRSSGPTAKMHLPPREEFDPGENPWRTRVNGKGWEINTGHPDYISAEVNSELAARYQCICGAGVKATEIDNGEPARFLTPTSAVEYQMEILARVDRRWYGVEKGAK